MLSYVNKYASYKFFKTVQISLGHPVIIVILQTSFVSSYNSGYKNQHSTLVKLHSQQLSHIVVMCGYFVFQV